MTATGCFVGTSSGQCCKSMKGNSFVVNKMHTIKQPLSWPTNFHTKHKEGVGRAARARLCRDVSTVIECTYTYVGLGMGTLSITLLILHSYRICGTSCTWCVIFVPWRGNFKKSVHNIISQNGTQQWHPLTTQWPLTMKFKPKHGQPLGQRKTGRHAEHGKERSEVRGQQHNHQ